MSHPNIYRDVLEFNRAVLPGMVDRTEHGPTVPDDPSRHLGAKLVLEEVVELMQALRVNFDVGFSKENLSYLHDAWLLESRNVDIVEAADAIADILYVVIGVALRLGINEDTFYRIWAEVTRANMDKANGPMRADGKRLKPSDWTPPNVKEALYGPVVSVEHVDGGPGTKPLILTTRRREEG